MRSPDIPLAEVTNESLHTSLLKANKKYTPLQFFPGKLVGFYNGIIIPVWSTAEEQSEGRDSIFHLEMAK